MTDTDDHDNISPLSTLSGVLWLAEACRRCTGAHLPELAGWLVEQADPASAAANLDHDKAHRLLYRLHARPEGLRRLLDNLAAAGLLHRTRAPSGDHLGCLCSSCPNREPSARPMSVAGRSRTGARVAGRSHGHPWQTQLAGGQ
jgi:hypothetical protein